MPYVEVYVDACDALADVSEEDLRQELANRMKKKIGQIYSARDYSIPPKEAQAAAEEASNLLRRAGRLDLAYKLDEINADFLGR